MNSLPRSEDNRPVFQELLDASKGAERLISAFFELGMLHGEPFLDIWDKLEKAIDKAQGALKTIH